MKRLLVPALLLNAVLLGVRAWQDVPRAAVAGRLATANGDTNGDGERDISDALRLLMWLFGDAPEPVALAQEEGLTSDEINRLRPILAYLSLGVTRVGTGASAEDYVPAVRISGANLQVVNGLSGGTDGRADSTGGRYEDVVTNGVGNIIIGYSEMPHTPDAGLPAERLGSHNLIIGSTTSTDPWEAL